MVLKALPRALSPALARPGFGASTLHTTTSANLLSRSLHASSAVRAVKLPEDDPKQGGTTFWSALLYGSREAKADSLLSPSNSSSSSSAKQQHSKLIGRGKYVHEIVTHSVLPHRRTEYLLAAEAFYKALLARREEFGGIKVTGAWECVVGSVGDFTHIFEYEGYRGFDEFMVKFRADKEMQTLLNALLPHLQSRQHQLVSEFSFWPSSPPNDSGFPDGGIFEMRSYKLYPGKLLEWEGAWRRGLEARRRFVSPVGAFFAQVGELHEVHHIWQYPDMETRKATREQAWSVGSWADTVQDTVRLTREMKTSILKPLSWSPLR